MNFLKYLVTGIFIFLLVGACKERNQTESQVEEPIDIEEVVEKASKYLFTGTYTKKEGHVDGKAEGVQVFAMPEDSLLVPVYTEKRVINPSFVTISADGKYMYAVNETGPDVDSTGSVGAFVIDRDKGELHLINTQSSHGLAPCYITTDTQNRLALVTNYIGGVVSVYPLQSNGALQEASQVLVYEGRSSHNRQDSSHPHSVRLSPSGEFAYVADLGTDKLMMYRVDYESSQLIPLDPPFIKMASRAGPRHMSFHPNNNFLFVVNELNSTIVAFRHDPESGQLEGLQTIRTLPRNFRGSNTCADIHVTNDGSFLYATNRGHNSLAIFQVNLESGKLTSLGHEPTQGDHPRNFMIDGLNLYVANQNDDNVVMFRIRENGSLNYVKTFDVLTPVCLQVYQY